MIRALNIAANLRRNKYLIKFSNILFRMRNRRNYNASLVCHSLKGIILRTDGSARNNTRNPSNVRDKI